MGWVVEEDGSQLGLFPCLAFGTRANSTKTLGLLGMVFGSSKDSLGVLAGPSRMASATAAGSGIASSLIIHGWELLDLCEPDCATLDTLVEVSCGVTVLPDTAPRVPPLLLMPPCCVGTAPKVPPILLMPPCCVELAPALVEITCLIPLDFMNMVAVTAGSILVIYNSRPSGEPITSTRRAGMAPGEGFSRACLTASGKAAISVILTKPCSVGWVYTTNGLPIFVLAVIAFCLFNGNLGVGAGKGLMLPSNVLCENVRGILLGLVG